MGYFKYLIPVILAMVFWYVFFVIITITTANANTPDWVLGKEHKSFPEKKYLVGVGVSEKSPIMATQSARAEIAKTISIRVVSDASDYNSREKSVSESSIVTETDFLLEGSQVKDGWYDDRNDLYYSLKQGEDCLSDYDIITALVHFYDGYQETDKLLPYITTYNSVIMVTNGQKYRGWYDYKIIFKEKIQSIVNKISLDKVSESVDHKKIPSNVRALFDGKAIKDFPIKFYKVERHDDINIFVKAGVDLQTFEKHFNHTLKKELFGRLKLINVSFKATKRLELSFPYADNKNSFPVDVEPAPIRYPVQTSNWNLNLGLGNGNINLWGGW